MYRKVRFQMLTLIAVAGMVLWLTTPPHTSGANAPFAPFSDDFRLYAGLSGAAIGGTTPNGLAEYSQRQDGRRKMEVTVNAVNLAAGTTLGVKVNGTTVGQLVINQFNGGFMEIDTNNGQSVPVITSGASLTLTQGTSTILTGVFSTTEPTPSPGATVTPSPGATATPSPNPTASVTPSPGGTPGNIVEITTPLNGAQIGGVTPTGRAKYEQSFGETKLVVEVRSINLPAGTRLDVFVNNTNLGQITLRTDGRGELRVYGSNVPPINPGTTVTVKRNADVIVSGAFPNGINPTPSPSATPSPNVTPSPGVTPSPSPETGNCVIRLSAANYTVGENAGKITITVTRACDAGRSSRVEYETEQNTARERSDFTRASGRLFFAAGETSKTFEVIITDDNRVESNETFIVKLEEAEGTATLGNPNVAIVTITDNDLAQAANNPFDQAQFFVQQHYADFLSRVPDDGGLDYWTNAIAQCGTNDDCVRAQRIGVSAAFFIELEFQDSGSFVYRMYRASFGRQPVYDEFAPDRARIVGGSSLEDSKRTFADDWVNRPAFLSAYPADLIPAQFVENLFLNAGLTDMSYNAAKQQQITAMNNGATRAQVLRSVIELQGFKEREYNPSFVLMQYFGYLRRDPDAAGYQFWLDVLNRREPNNYRVMVCNFITSAEAQDRFSLNTPHSNAECSGVN